MPARVHSIETIVGVPIFRGARYFSFINGDETSLGDIIISQAHSKLNETLSETVLIVPSGLPVSEEDMASLKSLQRRPCIGYMTGLLTPLILWFIPKLTHLFIKDRNGRAIQTSRLTAKLAWEPAGMLPELKVMRVKEEGYWGATQKSKTLQMFEGIVRCVLNQESYIRRWYTHLSRGQTP
ncbi:hypothetical protein PM082_006737 [Marasmius tenuissimus]|nr:hypothetical protein PM082_006737 [Marasmius tenuissimus]